MKTAESVTSEHARSDLGWDDWEARVFVAVLGLATAAAGFTVWICVGA
jgi:hypothetical protein